MQTGKNISIKEFYSLKYAEDYFDFFDGPPATLNAQEFPLPVSSLLEKACLPTVDDAVGLIRKAAKREI